MITLRSAAMRGLIKFVLIATCSCATTQEPAEKPTTKPVTSRRAKRPPKPPIADNLTSSEDLAPAEGAPPIAAPEGEVLGEGIASFYADSLSGNRTANGERYRPDARTCAHRKLPFGTKLRIIAVKSGKTSTCRVNDRGPFVAGRILDVSKIVARELGMVDAGIAEVRIERAGDGDS